MVLSFSNGEKIECTKEHPFYVEHKGFTPAGELGIGTSIVTRAGPVVKLTHVETKREDAAAASPDLGERKDTIMLLFNQLGCSDIA